MDVGSIPAGGTVSAQMSSIKKGRRQKAGGLVVSDFHLAQVPYAVKVAPPPFLEFSHSAHLILEQAREYVADPAKAVLRLQIYIRDTDIGFLIPDFFRAVIHGQIERSDCYASLPCRQDESVYAMPIIEWSAESTMQLETVGELWREEHMDPVV